MTDTTTRALTPQQRADIATARGTLWRIAAGADDADPDTAASMLDRVLATACPHDPARTTPPRQTVAGGP